MKMTNYFKLIIIIIINLSINNAIAGINDPVINKISSGGASSCAVINYSIFKCWGNNFFGQLGLNGRSPLSLSIPTTTVNINNILNIDSIASSISHTCVSVSGAVSCWGKSDVGQLGNGVIGLYSVSPVFVQNINNATQVSVNISRSCALLLDSTVKCWGSGWKGSLGNGSTTDSSIPVAVSDINNAINISVGPSTSCATLSTGEIKCWGDNFYSQLSTSSSYSAIPVLISSINNAVSVSVGFSHVCAIINDGTVKCWGDGSRGQIGNGAYNNSSPTLVSNINNAIAISSGSNHNCALLSNNNVKCWGSNNSGQLGYGGTEQNSNIPKDVNINNVTSIVSGEDYTCANLSTRDIKCWGNGSYGQLGNGTTTSSYIPSLVYLYPVESISNSTSSIQMVADSTTTIPFVISPVSATNKSILWTSSATSVATINNTTGVISSLSAGTTTITAVTVDGGYKATATVLVYNNVFKSSSTTITLNKSSIYNSDIESPLNVTGTSQTGNVNIILNLNLGASTTPIYYTDSTTSDAIGRFKFSIPSNIISGLNNGAYRANFTFSKTGYVNNIFYRSLNINLTSATATIITNPNNVSININNSTIFQIVATSTLGSLSYQWQSSTDNINFTDVISGIGATSSSYTTPIKSVPGTSYYRVMVINTEAGKYTFYATSSSAILTVLDPTASISPTTSISGSISYFSSTSIPIPGAQISLTNIDTNTLVSTTTTNNTGNYTFNNVTSGGNYSISVLYTGASSTNGIDINDNIRNAQIIVGTYTPTDDAKISADTTQDGIIDINDNIRNAQIIVGTYSLPIPFIFIPTDKTDHFSTSTDNINKNYTLSSYQSKSITNLQSDTTINFKGYKVGDSNGDWR